MGSPRKNKANQTTIRVSPGLLTKAIAQMSTKQRTWLAKTGFKNLLGFSFSSTPHELAHRILTTYDIEKQCLNLGEKTIQLTEEDVNRVLGFPRGSEQVQFAKDSAVAKAWEAQFSTIPSRITPKEIFDKMKSTVDVTANFKRNFLVVLANTMISPPKDAFATRDLAGFQGDLDHLYNYNWCSYTLYRLKNAVQRWREKPALPFTGPLHFLVVSFNHL